MAKRSPMNASPRTVREVMDLADGVFPGQPGPAYTLATYVLGFVEREVELALRTQEGQFQALLRESAAQQEMLLQESLTRAYLRGRQEALAAPPAAN